MSCALGSVLLAYSTQNRGTPAIFVKATGAKTLYLIISPHRPGECSKAVDAISSLDPIELSQWSWGCSAGDHTGYLMIEAESQQAALMMVPESFRSRARVIKLEKHTADQWSTVGGGR